MISSFYEKIVGSSPPPERNDPKILCVGLCCLDIVQTCKEYPLEDSDQRTADYRWQRGGNASNTCTVLSLLGNPCEFLGSLSTEQHLQFLQDDMRKYKIDFSHCPMVDGIGCPTSTVILSLSTGSRTILHHNPSLPELTLSEFQKLNLEDYSWIHFEGRNIVEFLSMMQYIETYNNSFNCKHEQLSKAESLCMPITISVELERPKSELVDLLPYADVAFIAKEFAESRGFENMGEALRSIAEEAKTGATVICAWGDRGAMARTPDGIVVQSPAFPPPRVIDSLGAGDTFNAAVLYYLNKTKLRYTDRKTKKEKDVLNGDKSDEKTTNEFLVPKMEIKKNYNIESLEYCQTEFINQNVLQTAITFACQVAGTKVGLRGYDGIKQSSKNIFKS